MIAGMEAAFDSHQDDNGEDLAKARGLYWRALVQLKVSCEYTQRYRDRLGIILTSFAVSRAVVSVGALGSWFAGLGQAKVWGLIIVISQTLDAVMGVLPLSTRARALRAFVAALDVAFIDAQFEWEEDVNSANATAQGVRRRWHKLLRLQHEAETADMAAAGLPRKERLFKLAEEAAASYLEANFGVSRT